MCTHGHRAAPMPRALPWRLTVSLLHLADAPARGPQPRPCEEGQGCLPRRTGPMRHSGSHCRGMRAAEAAGSPASLFTS
jgi:hypothetical protein